MGWVVTAAASGIITFVAATAVFVDPTSVELLVATIVVWIPLLVAFRATGGEPRRLSTFAVVFCGSLLGLTLLVSTLLGGTVLGIGLYGLAELRLAVPINPVMAVLVGGAVSLAYYAVFEWGDASGSVAS